MRIDWLTLAAALLAMLGPGADARAQARRSLYGPESEVPSRFGSRTLGWPVYPKPRDFGGGGAFGARPNLGRGFQARRPYTFADGIEPMPVVPGEGFWNDLPQASRLGPDVGAVTRQPNGQPPQAPQALGPEGQLAGQGDSAGSGERSEVWFRQPPEVGADQSAIGMQAPAEASRRGYRRRSLPIGWYRTDAALVQRIRRTLESRFGSALEVSIDDETVVLRGTVATEHDRKLAALVARFEPRVRFVRNELTVEGAEEETKREAKEEVSSEVD